MFSHKCHKSLYFRPKHVSFARSHTLTSFDDAVVSLSSSSSNISRVAKSQERLLDVRKIPDPIPITKQPEPTDNVLLLGKTKQIYKQKKKGEQLN